MSPTVKLVESDASLPDKVDAVVIGGGIVGTAAAYYLARRGMSVALIEKGRIAGEQSSRNWGWCRQTGKSLSELPLIRHSLDIWRELNAEIGLDTGFRQTGSLIVSNDAAEIAEWEKWREETRPLQVHAQLLSSSDIQQLLPSAGTRWKAGLYSPYDGKAEPSLAAPAIARAAQNAGATLHQNCAARGMEMAGGTIASVVTEKGTIRTGAVLCAAGAWTSMFCRWHGVSLPQAGVFATACRTEPCAEIVKEALGCDQFSVRRREDGGYTVALRARGRVELSPQGLRYAREFLPLFRKRAKNLTLRVGASFFSGPEAWSTWALDQRSPFEKHRVFDPAPDQALVDKAMRQFKAAFPSLADVRVAESWGGFIDRIPDALPVISPIEALPGFVVATGFSGKGFGVGPAAGHLAAALLVGEKPAVDPHQFRFSRMSDGTMKPGSGWI